MSVQQPDDKILHQSDVEDVVEDVIEAGVGLTGDAIDDASVAHALNATFSDTEVEGALDALGGTLNEILAVLRTNGLIAASE